MHHGKAISFFVYCRQWRHKFCRPTAQLCARSLHPDWHNHHVFLCESVHDSVLPSRKRSSWCFGCRTFERRSTLFRTRKRGSCGLLEIHSLDVSRCKFHCSKEASYIPSYRFHHLISYYTISLAVVCFAGVCDGLNLPYDCLVIAFQRLEGRGWTYKLAQRVAAFDIHGY